MELKENQPEGYVQRDACGNDFWRGLLGKPPIRAANRTSLLQKARTIRIFLKRPVILKDLPNHLQGFQTGAPGLTKSRL